MNGQRTKKNQHMTTNEKGPRWTWAERAEWRRKIELDMADERDFERQVEAMEERETEQDRAEDASDEG